MVWVLVEMIALYKNSGLQADRILPEKFSNSDENEVFLILENHYNFNVELEVIDEIPIQFQKRDFLKRITLAANEKSKTTYLLKPVERGVYTFGSLNCYALFGLKLIKRRYKFNI